MSLERREDRDRLRELSRRTGIKLITGMRRSGKSALLAMFAEELHGDGVPPEHVITIDFDELRYEESLDYHALHAYLEECLGQGRKIYLFLDELPGATEFEQIVGSLYLNRRLDIYIATSHAGLVGRELATVLSGGFGEMHVLPLSFRDYCRERRKEPEEDEIALFEEYIHQSGLPGALCLFGEGNARLRREYLEGCLSSLLLWDVMARWQFRDMKFLRSILCFLYDHLGEALSPARIVAAMKERGNVKSLSVHTVSDYLRALEESYLIYRVPRCDVRSRRVLKSTEKVYSVDPGFPELLLGAREPTIGMMENLVYLELRRRGYRVYGGRVGTKEISFLAVKGDPVYLQVGDSPEKLLSPLQQIGDQYPKYVLTPGARETTNRGGIPILSVAEFLRETLIQ